MNLNRVEICGGMTRDPEIRSLPSGILVAEMSIALNGTRYDGTAKAQVVKTTYVTVQAFGWLAERIVQMNLSSGCEVYVLGELDQSEFEKRDGTKEKKTRINASVIEVVRARHSMTTAPVAAQPDREGWQHEPPPDSGNEPPF